MDRHIKGILKAYNRHIKGMSSGWGVKFMTFLRRNWKSISSGMTQNRELYCLIGKIHDFLIWDPNLSRGTFLSQVKFIKLAIK